MLKAANRAVYFLYDCQWYHARFLSLNFPGFLMQ